MPRFVIKTKASSPTNPLRRWLRMIIWIILIGLTSLGLFFFIFDRHLPDIQDLTQLQRRPSWIVYDSSGEVIATYGDVYGEAVHAKNLPKYILQALVAVEDRRFYQHIGLDVRGLVRAFFKNFQAGHIVQGGSTLTQQLAKNFLQEHSFYTHTDRSWRRKIQEALLAFRIEQRFSKDEILTLYLNRVYFGSGIVGIDGAARGYFGKPAAQLALYEAAVLIGLLQSPARYSPMSHPQRSFDRANTVLKAMVESHFISDKQLEMALTLSSSAVKNISGSQVRYFTDWVIQNLPDALVNTPHDLQIFTTLDSRLQRIAEKCTETTLAQQKWGAEHIALVAMTLDGAITCMVGGKKYSQSQFNRATQALRQPGSAFKLLTFLTAFEQGYLPSDTIDDSPYTHDDWKPSNYRYTSQGTITLRKAFAQSANGTAARLGAYVGIKKIVAMARRLGISSPLSADMTLTLGSGETSLIDLSTAFGTVANGGMRVRPYGIRKILNSQGDIVFQPTRSTKIDLEPRVVQSMISLLEEVLESGTGRQAQLGRPAGGKSGTSQDYRDLWFLGFTPHLVAGVWCGKDNGQAMNHKPGGSPALLAWQTFMKQSHQTIPPRSFPSLSQLGDIVQLPSLEHLLSSPEA